MKMRNSKKPAWWKLYLLGGLVCAGLAGEATLPLAATARKILLMVIVVTFYMLVGAWLKDNHSYMEDEAEEKSQAIVQPVQSQRPVEVNYTSVQAHYREVMAQKQGKAVANAIDTHRKVN
jgi:membrane glycosyltransferase